MTSTSFGSRYTQPGSSIRDFQYYTRQSNTSRKSREEWRIPPSLNKDGIRDFVTTSAEFKGHRQKENSPCQCGHSVDWHEKNGIPADTSKEPKELRTLAEHWQPNPEGTRTFGFIKFRGFGSKAWKMAPYIRLDCKTPNDTVWELLGKHWRMPKPKLIISVTGGAENFELKDKLKTSFKRGLVNAATTTRAWIVTGGTGTGVMKFIGAAVKEHVLATGGLGKKVVVLGIAAWGNVANKEALVGENNEGRFPAVYSSTKCSGSGAPLDHNHTHFILVDDGTEGKFGGEIEFRTELESYISNTLHIAASGNFDDNTGGNVPVVTLMLEGDPNTIKTALEAVKHDTPVVIIQGSGRAADLIAEAFYVKDHNVKFWRDFNKKVDTTFDLKQDEDKIESVKRDVEDFLKYPHLVTLMSGDELNNIDHAILKALLEGKKYNVKTLLNLSLAWNRIGVAQELFSKKYREQSQKVDLIEPMLTALVNDQPDFVQLFLDNGVDLQEFLTVRRLRDLYHNVFMSITAEEGVQLLSSLIRQAQLGNVICCLLRDWQENYYKDFSDSQEKESEHPEIELPKRELFIWATLLNRKELALLFWKAGVDHIGGALMACALLKALSNSADDCKQVELSLNLASHSESCEEVAFGVLRECYNQDRVMARKLLVRELTTWKKRTLLSIAYSAGEMAFIGHTACQQLLNEIWRGKMAPHTSSMKVLAGVFIPFVIFFIEFTTGKKGSRNSTKQKLGKSTGPAESEALTRTDDEDEEADKQQQFHKVQCGNQAEKSVANDKDEEADKQQQYYKVAFCQTKNIIRVPNAIYYFHAAPISKFICHTITQVILLCLFSYFVLSDLHPITDPDSPSSIEVTVWVWTATLLVEEMRQVLIREEKSFYYKMYGYLNSFWNVWDFITHFLLATSIVLRIVLSGHNFYWARMCYCITLSFYFIRFMQVFFVNKKIGPKVIMISQMLTDVVFFLSILVVFLLAFGVTSQALRYPNSKQTWVLLKDVILTPYWQMYGELFLDEVHGDIDACSNNRTEWELDPSVPRCPEKSMLVAALLALYMILTNVLLLNLLIAMFSHTFKLVQDNSERVWRYYRYSLIHEYYHRPTLTPPLIIFNHIWCLLKYFKRSGAENSKTSSKFKVEYSRDEADQLSIFERVAMERYFFYLQTSQLNEQLNVQISSTRDRIEKVIEDLDELKDREAKHQPGHFCAARDGLVNSASTCSYISPESIASHHHANSESGMEHLGEQTTAGQQQLEVQMANLEKKLSTILEALDMEQSTSCSLS